MPVSSPSFAWIRSFVDFAEQRDAGDINGGSLSPTLPWKGGDTTLVTATYLFAYLLCGLYLALFFAMLVLRGAAQKLLLQTSYAPTHGAEPDVEAPSHPHAPSHGHTSGHTSGHAAEAAPVSVAASKVEADTVAVGKAATDAAAVHV